MNKKILSLIVVLSVVAMLSVPLSACAKSTTEEISFRIETWPDVGISPDADLSKFKQIIAGESGKVKLNRLPTIGIPPLLDEVPVGPMFGTGGVRLTIGNDDPIEGTVKVEIIHVNLNSMTSYTSIEKWAFIFAEGTLELSATVKDGEGTCIGTNGSGIFENTKLTASFTDQLIWYGQAAYGIKEGIGQIVSH